MFKKQKSETKYAKSGLSTTQILAVSLLILVMLVIPALSFAGEAVAKRGGVPATSPDKGKPATKPDNGKPATPPGQVK